ncbi:helix-turn-helix domain-containing protein [Roseibium salinum]|uniref:AraC family transcriptional regulator n=1 Tax=Roseibium salinum TaxID=1604349 RepID=A0ABT3QYV6_9HYPH|nr:AraC family transcriptional regulator [Roseibium sp. DSM 29163]MCX2722133.1 AraC family transcriptional regulator [Roseibium sp. DSM 29163]
MPVPFRTSFNGKLDRLSSLIDRLKVQVSDILIDCPVQETSNFAIYSGSAGTLRLAFCPLKDGARAVPEMGPIADENPLVGARIMISGIGRHLVDALPDHISVPLGEQPYLTAVVMPLIEEVTTPRCGGQAAFQRLCEVVVIRLLRHAMEEGRADSGLLSGLAHPRIAAALVAIHEAPAQAWTLEKLADTAGMSRTQFAVTFKELVGTTPMVYLAHWRLDIARAELETGRQVKSVASLCGFTSPAAFSRAFSRRFGYPPRQRRAQAA